MISISATSQAHGTREVVLRISAIHNDRKALRILSSEIIAVSILPL